MLVEQYRRPTSRSGFNPCYHPQNFWKFELRPEHYACAPDESSPDSTLKISFPPSNYGFRLPTIDFNQQHTSNVDTEIQRLMGYSEYLAQYAAERALGVKNMNLDWFDSWYHYDLFWQGEEFGTQIEQQLVEILSADPTLFAAGLIGYYFHYRYNYEKTSLDSMWGIPEENAPFLLERSADASADLTDYLSQLHFSESDSLVSKIYKHHSEFNPEQLHISLTNLVTATGLQPEVANLRVARQGRQLSISVLDSATELTDTLTIPDTVIGLRAVEGGEGSGKTTTLELLGMPVLEVAHPEKEGFIALASRLLPSNQEFLNTIAQINKDLELARSSEDKEAFQAAIVAVRKAFSSALGIDENHLYLSPFSEIVCDRSLFTNIAYSLDALDFFKKLHEIIETKFIPETVYLLMVPAVIGAHTAQARPGADFLDRALLQEHLNRNYKYKLLAKLFPDIFVLINGYRYDQFRRVYVRKTPDKIATEIQNHIRPRARQGVLL